MRNPAPLLVALLAPLLLVGSIAEGRGKTYKINGMGTHFTRKGRELRRGRPHKRVPLVQLRTGPGFVLARDDLSWGTQLAVDELRRVMAAFEKQYPDAQPIIIGDLSKKGGGYLDNHNSHVNGRDVDIRLPLVPLADITDKTPRRAHPGYTWLVIRELARGCNVEYIFLDKRVQRVVSEYASGELGVSKDELELILQYPRDEKTNAGIVRHWTRHQDHLHVRFRHAGAPEAAPAAAYCAWKKSRFGAE